MSGLLPRLAATVGAAFLLVTALGAPAPAMLVPFDPAPMELIDPSQDATTPHCFMGHPSWPGDVEPQANCTT